jgi:hypothetical protein
MRSSQQPPRLSVSAYHRILKVSRTIAVSQRFGGSASGKLTEVVDYRSLDSNAVGPEHSL